MNPPQGYEPDEADGQAWKAYQAAVDAELVKLGQIRGGEEVYQKRRNTIWEIAWSRVTGHIALDQVFSLTHTVSKSIYYHKKKGWYHNPVFKQVLDAVTKLTRELVEGKRGRALERLQQEWQAGMVTLTDKAFKKLEFMLDFPLTEVEFLEEEREETDESGRVVKVIRQVQVIKPAGWNYANLPGLMRETDRAGRLARQMATDKSEVTGEGGEPLQAPVTYIVENRPNVPVSDKE
jgi:hypothetical protein